MSIECGSLVEDRFAQQFDHHRREAVARRENEVRKEAEQQRLCDLELARQAARRELEENTRRMRREMEQAVERKAARVKSFMKAEGDKRVEDEYNAGQGRLKAALLDAHKQANLERKEAVERARAEEREFAEKESKKMEEKHDLDMEEVKRLGKKNLTDGLGKQREELMMERKEAVARAVQEANTHAAEILGNVQRSHEARVSELRVQLEELLQELERSKLSVSRSESMRKDAEIKLAQMTLEFSHFINQVPGYSADYLLKSVCSTHQPVVLLLKGFVF